MARNDVGRVIANYDIDHRSSGYGRGSDDHFIPDIERLDRGRPRPFDRSHFGLRAVAAGATLGLLLMLLRRR